MHITPCLPADWPNFEATLQGPTGSLNIRIENPDGLQSGDPIITVDGQSWPGGGIPLPEDGRSCSVQVILRGASARS